MPLRAPQRALYELTNRHGHTSTTHEFLRVKFLESSFEFEFITRVQERLNRVFIISETVYLITEYASWPPLRVRFRFRFSFIELVARKLKIKKLNEQ